MRKVRRQLKREGFDVARCTVSRLMQDIGLQGVIRGKTVKTTISDKAAPYPLDHVNRQFKDILISGAFKVSGPLAAERDEPTLSNLHRLVFHFNKRDHGRLRELIDYLNDLPVA